MKRYLSKSGKRSIVKHVYEEGRERSIHLKKRRKAPANKKTQILPPKVNIEAKAPGRFMEHPAVAGVPRRPLYSDNYELPSHYGTTRLVLIVKDPFWIYAYWEISPDSLESLKRVIQEKQIREARTVLRMYDVTLIDFNGTNAHSYFDIEVGNNNTGNWYISLWRDNISYVGELGLKTAEGNFHSLARSNCVHTPRAGYSSRTEQISMKVEDNKPITAYISAYPQSGRTPQRHQVHTPPNKKKVFYIIEDEIRRYYASLSRPLRDIISKRLSRFYGPKFVRYGFLLKGETEEEKARILSGFPKEYFLKKLLLGSSEELILLESNRQIGGGASEFVQGKIKQQNFFFELNTELIVYGRTEPNAKVELGGKEIKLLNDGTFRLRFALPDGKIPLEFKAISRDKTQARKINTYIERRTDKGDSK